MGRGVFLTNPDLNIDDVALDASSELSPRPGQPYPCGLTTSGLLTVAATGDAGDELDHDVEFFGSDVRSNYAPYDENNVVLKSDPATQTALATAITPGNSRFALVAADDRLHLLLAPTAGGALVVRVWTGSTGWVEKAQLNVSACNALAACAIGQAVYIAVASNSGSVIQLYRYQTMSGTIGTIHEGLISTDGQTTSLALATNGTTFVLLNTHIISGRSDTTVYYGDLTALTKRRRTILDTFESAWGLPTNGGVASRCSITWNSTHGFVAAFRTNNATLGNRLRLAQSQDGDKWEQFKNHVSSITQPTMESDWADVAPTAIALEGWRAFVWRITSANPDGNARFVRLQWYGPEGWSTGITMSPETPPLSTTTSLAATSWRGTLYYAYVASSGALVVRKCYDLQTDGTIERAFVMGEPTFVAGVDDDSGTSLWFVANGAVRTGDRYRIPGQEFDYRAEHVVDDFTSRVWRGDHTKLFAPGYANAITFDAGVGKAFAFDTVAIFGSNLYGCTLQASDEADFTPLKTNQAISATVQTAMVVSGDRNRAVFAADTFEPHAYAAGGTAKHWLHYGSVILRILDNDDHSLTLDGNASWIGGEAVIFRSTMGYLFDTVQGPARYVRILTPSLLLDPPDGYNEIARVIFGLRFEPAIDYRVEWRQRHEQPMGRVELRDGARYNTPLHTQQRPAWDLSFRRYHGDVRPVMHFFGRAQGGVRLVAFWPDAVGTGNQPVVHPTYFVPDPAELSDMRADVGEVAVTLEGQL